MNCYKLTSESDDEYLHRSDELLAQIGNDVKDYHQIQLMIFFKGMNYVIKQKICRHSKFLNSCEDLVTLVKKLHSSLETEGHLQTTTTNTYFSEGTNVNTAKWKD